MSSGKLEDEIAPEKNTRREAGKRCTELQICIKTPSYGVSDIESIDVRHSVDHDEKGTILTHRILGILLSATWPANKVPATSILPLSPS